MADQVAVALCNLVQVWTESTSRRDLLCCEIPSFAHRRVHVQP
ncbi:BZ3500_MvSof-1268-A1-R1_Chr1-1g00973 [Microbotryum saponariae]|uniref:BZ3500_MvSof-1268-A1-R1_Chr1-1g00973 protein n=1 Tax=Microbotryum saponariae TaxID=289078 RepID=A0A2X0K7W9_9BASI|nr:BZ3500_MvSof-1268-A1-R1_Chr1-1g00973 [Microbotryum saponariae]SCZ93073.1 BZ3501_MvSof-1269-A2-R1_Chr1-1g00570 [Microbotryum saponariae]